MSHFTVLVPANDEKHLAEVLQPYHEYECTGVKDQYVVFVKATQDEIDDYQDCKEDYTSINDFMKFYYGYEYDKGVWGKWTNPNRKWDWWVIGGRWTGSLRLKKATLKAGIGKPGLLTAPSVDPNKCDYGPSGEIDWDGMASDWREKQRQWYADCNYYLNLAMEKYSELSRFPQLVKDKANSLWNDSGKRGELAKETFLTLHTCMLYEYADYLAGKDNKHWYYGWDKIKQILMTTQEFEKTLHPPAAQTYAFIDLVGQWNQRGEMGWFGMDDKEKGTENYDQAWWDFVKSLPENQMVYVVDCHI